MSLIICEIFQSIQGESSHAGWPCVFVRVSGCNLRCRWCDTTYAYEGGTQMSAEDVVEQIDSFGACRIEFTGGEPLLQSEVVLLASQLASSGRTVLVETNGSLDISVLDPKVIAIMDIKGPSSGMAEHMDLTNLLRLRWHDEVKFVIGHRDDYAHMLKILPHIDTRRNIVNVSPLFNEMSTADLAKWVLEDRLELRLNLQQHKYIWSPDKRGV